MHLDHGHSHWTCIVKGIGRRLVHLTGDMGKVLKGNVGIVPTTKLSLLKNPTSFPAPKNLRRHKLMVITNILLRQVIVHLGSTPLTMPDIDPIWFLIHLFPLATLGEVINISWRWPRIGDQVATLRGGHHSHIETISLHNRISGGKRVGSIEATVNLNGGTCWTVRRSRLVFLKVINLHHGIILIEHVRIGIVQGMSRARVFSLSNTYSSEATK